MKMNHSDIPMGLAISLTAVFTLVLVISPAFAQEGGGHAMDANPAQYGGSQNAERTDQYGQYGNDIVTGNVGAKYFRGDVGYRSSRDFSGDLPTDTLYRFRADSLPSGLGTQVRDAGVRADNITVYRSFADPDAGGTAPAAFSLGGSEQIYRGGALRTGANYLTNPSARLNRDDILRSTPSGVSVQQTQLTPLLGVRESFDVTRGEQLSNPFSSSNSGEQSQLDLREGDSGSTEAEAVASESMFDVNRLSSGLRVTRQTSERYDLGDAREDSANSMFDETPGLQLGRQLQGRSTTEPLDQQRGDQSALSRLQTLLDEAAQDPEMLEDVDSAYGRIVKSMRESQEAQEAYFQEVWGAQNQEQWGVDGSTFGVSDQTLNDLRQQRETQLRAMGLWRNDQDDADAENSNSTTRPTNPANPDEEQEDDPSQEILNNAKRLIEEINITSPRIATLAGERDSQINKLYHQAEAQIKDNRFFDAESTYRKILVLSDQQPLAHVGMANAMIGAGMVRSAAGQLHQVFEKHPELISVRYDPQLLPRGQRLTELRNELQQSMENDPRNAPKAALVAAYLGYQVGSRQMTEYGLLIGQTESPDDMLWPVLRSVWLDEQNSRQGVDVMDD